MDFGQVRKPRKCKRRVSNPEGLSFDPIDSDLHEVTWHSRDGYILHIENTRDTVTGKWKSRTIYAHRVILERVLGRKLERKEMVDHLDRNPSNCKRDNLILAKGKQNYENKTLAKNNSTGHRGVHFCQSRKRYLAYARHNGKKIYGGISKSAEEAGAMAAALRKKLGFHEGVPVSNEVS